MENLLNKTAVGNINCSDRTQYIEEQISRGLRLDDLQVNGLAMLQNPSHFCFGSDGVRLANFVTERKGNACDLGAGNGIIPILLRGKFGLTVTGVEVQKELFELLEINFKINGFSDCTAVYSKMQDFVCSSNAGEYSVVTANPPYRKMDSGFSQDNQFVHIARHEVLVTLKEVVAAAAHLVKSGGSVYIINHIERLAETMALLVDKKLEPKILQILKPSAFLPPHLFMVKAKKDGKPGGLVVRNEEVV